MKSAIKTTAEGSELFANRLCIRFGGGWEDAVMILCFACGGVAAALYGKVAEAWLCVLVLYFLGEVAALYEKIDALSGRIAELEDADRRHGRVS